MKWPTAFVWADLLLGNGLRAPLDPRQRGSAAFANPATIFGVVEVWRRLLATAAERTYASTLGWLEIMQLLLKRGADPNLASKNGETSLHRAARGDSLEAARLLLRSGANPMAWKLAHDPAVVEQLAVEHR